MNNGENNLKKKSRTAVGSHPGPVVKSYSLTGRESLIRRFPLLRVGASDVHRLVAGLDAEVSFFQNPFAVVAHEGEVGGFQFVIYSSSPSLICSSV